MLTWIARLSKAGLFAFSISAAGCQDRPLGEGAQPDRDAESRDTTLFGEWRWVASERGSEVIRPTNPSDSTTIEVGLLGRYREYTRGAPFSGRYSMAEGRLYQTQDTAFTVLMLDSSRFFPRSGDLGAAIAVRSLRGDSLFLSGTGTDTTFYTFVRVQRTP